MKIARKFRFGWLALAFMTLAACSNGRGSLSEPQGPVSEEPPPTPPASPPPPASAMAGYWRGAAVQDDSERRWTATALIAPSGEAHWIIMRDPDADDDDAVDGFVLHGNACCETHLDTQIAAKQLGETRTEEARLEVELDAGVLRGGIRFRGDRFELALNASPESGQPLTLAELSGTYTRSTLTLLGSQTTLTVTIDANGQLTGSHTNGCVFNGTTSIPDTTRSLVSLQVRLDNCGSSGASSKRWNGEYRGLGILLRDAVSPSNPLLREDVLYHSTVGPAWLGPQSVGK